MVINVRRDRWTFFSVSASIGSACTAENISTRTEQVTVAHPLSPHHPRLSMLPSFFCRKAIYSSGAGTKIATDQPLSREGPSDQELPHAEKPVESSPELPLPLAGLGGDETGPLFFDKTPSRRDGSHRRRAFGAGELIGFGRDVDDGNPERLQPVMHLAIQLRGRAARIEDEHGPPKSRSPGEIGFDQAFPGGLDRSWNAGVSISRQIDEVAVRID